MVSQRLTEAEISISKQPRGTSSETRFLSEMVTVSLSVGCRFVNRKVSYHFGLMVLRHTTVVNSCLVRAFLMTA